MTTEFLYRALAHVSAGTVLCPLFIFLFKIRNTKIVDRLLIIYLFVTIVTELFNFRLILKEKSTIEIENVFCITELSLFYLIYSKLIDNRKLFWTIVFSSSALILSVIIIGNISSKDWIAHFWKVIYMLTIIVFALFFYRQELQKQGLIPIIEQRNFWYNSGFFFYFGTSVFLFIANDFINSAQGKLGLYLWSIQLINNIIYFLILSKGVWMIKR